MPDSYGITYGDTDISPTRPDTVSGTKGADRLQTGGSDGSAYPGFQRMFGGEGNDTFILRAKDFDGSTTVSKYVSDFSGAAGTGPANWSATTNDFVAFSGFGSGASLLVVGERDGTVATSTTDKIFTYHIVDSSGNVLGAFDIQSLNGKALGAGDFAFY
ncbi:hypothetical protein [Sphingomonas adhaesiva]|uniref:hypothetical protein n=1 Tax=Sphingomonas adhaesiva TaxID=28212 RepID=UPI002FF7725F